MWTVILYCCIGFSMLLGAFSVCLFITASRWDDDSEEIIKRYLDEQEEE